MSISLPSLRPEADERAEKIFFETLKRCVDEREPFLKMECGTDTRLRAEVDGLLRDHEKAGSFLKVDGPARPELEAEFARLKPDEPGEKIGPYKLLQQIGEGGCGVVWMAEQEKPVRRRVALKIIKLGMDTKEVIARFEQERQALAVMEHPNIATVLDAGATQLGRPFFVMELVRGIKITEYCDEAHLPTHERLKLFIAVCNAVQHAHQKGIIHRDLKPSNILVTLHDGVPVPKVIDFGVAKATQQQRLTDLTLFTQFEQMIGTPLYMSPEQAEMSGLDIDTRSDIYSLGVLLYELLTGRTPFDPVELMKRGVDEIRRVIREEEPQKPSTFVSTMAAAHRTNVAQRRQADGAKLIGQIRGDLDWIVMKALEKDRTRRYETANGLARDIERHLQSEPVLARSPRASYRFRRWVNRNRAVCGAGAAVLLALLIGLAAFAWQAVQTNAALTNLRESAPAFASMSRTLVAKEQFDEAIAKLDIAIKLRPDVADYLFAKGNLLQSQLRFGEALSVYDEAVRVNPGNKRAEANAVLCRKLAAEMAAQSKLSRQSLLELFIAMTKEQRPTGEMMRVGKLLGEENKLLLAYWLDRLKDLPIPPDRPLQKRLIANEAGRLSLDLSGTDVEDLSQLEGMPLEHLILTGCDRVADLGSLRGMPLRDLMLGRLQVEGSSIPRPGEVRDLSPLQGMPLVMLDLEGTKVTDLTPLHGMPLESLILRETRVSELAPLQGMPLRYLDCSQIPARDFSPLTGAPLSELCLQLTDVGDLSFLRGMPLESLNLNGCSRARGYRALSDLKQLEILWLPESLAEFPQTELSAIEMLRDHPGLRQIHTGGSQGKRSTTASPKADFWTGFDRDRRVRAALREVAGGKAKFRTRSGGTWSVDMRDEPVSDLSPLRGAPISLLVIMGTKVSDLTPLEGMPLEYLIAHRTPITNLEPLKKLPLKQLLLSECPPGIDVSPLAEIATLEQLLLPPEPRNVKALQNLPNLARISEVIDEERRALISQSPEEFWSGKPPVTVETLAREGKFVEAEKLLRDVNFAELELYRLVRHRAILGVIVFAQHDEPHYQALCREMMERFHGTTAQAAELTVRICLLGSNSGVPLADLENLLKEARHIQPLNNNGGDVSLLLTTALFEYRADHPENAAKALHQIVTDQTEKMAASAVLLAMTYYQQRERSAAEAHLARARELVSHGWPQKIKGKGVAQDSWPTWLMAHVLLQEAERLIGGSESSPPVK